MIRAVAWFTSERHGIFVPGGSAWDKPSPPFSATGEILALIDLPVKYYGRMTAHARTCLCAATLAFRAAGWTPDPQNEVGILCAGCDGFIQTNQEYFQDYVASGQTLGRGNLFIYTLPTSAVGEVAIALSLAGPCLFVHSDSRPMGTLIEQADQLLSGGEADKMLAVWSNSAAALCVAVEPGQGDDAIAAMISQWNSDPLELIREFQNKARGA